MATTTPDNIWTPDAGDNYALTTDLAAMADTVQEGLNNVRVSGQYRVLTNAQRLALTGGDLFEGLRVRTSDTRLEWLYTNGVWVVDRGLFVVQRTNAQSLAAGWNLLNAVWGTPVVNDLGTWSAGVLTLSRAGIYRISLSAGTANTTSNGGVQVTKNSATPDTANSLGAVLSQSSQNSSSLSFVAPLAVNDALRSFIIGSASNAVDTTGSRGANFSVELLRAT